MIFSVQSINLLLIPCSLFTVEHGMHKTELMTSFFTMRKNTSTPL